LHLAKKETAREAGPFRVAASRHMIMPCDGPSGT
jgi:hypothetical protein